MKVTVLVVSLVVALFVGLSLAYADDVSVGDSMVIVAGPSVSQNNWFCATQEQNVTQLTFGANTQTATSTGGNVGGLSGNALAANLGLPGGFGGFGVLGGGPGNSNGPSNGSETEVDAESGGADAGDSLAGNLGLVGNVALTFQGQIVEAENESESNMYVGTAIGSFNRISRVKDGGKRGR